MHELLEITLSGFAQISFETFKTTVDSILQKHVVIKSDVRANQAWFINNNYTKNNEKDSFRK